MNNPIPIPTKRQRDSEYQTLKQVKTGKRKGETNLDMVKFDLKSGLRYRECEFENAGNGCANVSCLCCRCRRWAQWTSIPHSLLGSQCSQTKLQPIFSCTITYCNINTHIKPLCNNKACTNQPMKDMTWRNGYSLMHNLYCPLQALSFAFMWRAVNDANKKTRARVYR